MSAELIAKLESASEGSRELDGEVAEATVGFMEWDGRPVTTSIDAALALAERVLGDARWIITQQDTGWGVMPLVKTDGVWDSPNDPGETYGATLPIVICAALLRASAAEGAGHD